MIKREFISAQIKEIEQYNSEFFYPIIEEFFVRAVDQYKWNEQDLKIAISKLERIIKIEFVNFWDTNLFLLLKSKHITGQVSFDCKKNIGKIKLDVDDLKRILRFDKQGIESFINTVMHELGHTVQSKVERGYLYGKLNCMFYTGFSVDYIDGENYEVMHSDGIIANEFAEIVNARRLQKGNISDNEYQGYYTIQNAARVMLSSLGINEMEFSDLQVKGRKSYDDFVANRLGNIQAKLYTYSFEEILDGIHNFSKSNSQRKNLILQIAALQTLSKQLLEERVKNVELKSQDDLSHLAKIIIDKENRDIALNMVWDEFAIESSELEMEEEMDIYKSLANQGYSDEFLIKLSKVEVEERLKIQTEQEIQEQKIYDNEELKEKIYQSFLTYPINEVPLKDRPGVIVSKIIGKMKRVYLGKDNKLLVAGRNDNSTSKEFRKRIADLDEYTVDYPIENTSEKQIREDGMKDENSR